MSEKIKSTQGNKYIQQGKDDKIQAFYLTDFQYSILGKIIIFRLLQDRDMKMVITGKGKTTGTGKTTLAIHLARWINAIRNDIFDMNKQWSAKEYSFMNVWEYLESYAEADRGDPLITDELETMADRRRSNTYENVYFSQAWSKLRYKNVVTIGTAPHMSDLDKRIPETIDIWINVVKKGMGNTYYMFMHDFDWNQGAIPRRMKMFDYREAIHWNELENTEDYQYLKSLKEETGVPGMDNEKQLSEDDIKQAKKDIKHDMTVRLLELVEEKELKRTLTQADIADIVGYSQQNVAKIKRDNNI